MVADVRILRYYVRYLRMNTSAERAFGSAKPWSKGFRCLAGGGKGVTEVRHPDGGRQRGHPGGPGVFDWKAAAVPKVFQNSKKFTGKGLLFERKQEAPN
jgi:hypothetical protein